MEQTTTGARSHRRKADLAHVKGRSGELHFSVPADIYDAVYREARHAGLRIPEYCRTRIRMAIAIDEGRRR